MKKPGHRPRARSNWSSRRDINHALVEGVRPAMYKAMKYWGKKPHNIWAQYIAHYCPQGGLVLDPFAGSGIAAFEAIHKRRRAIALDLNPLTAFMIESLATPLDSDAFMASFARVQNALTKDEVYLAHYTREHKGDRTVVYNYRWLGSRVTHVALELPDGSRSLVPATKSDLLLAESSKGISIPFWYPKDVFPTTKSVTHKFIRDLGGSTIEHLWTRRNLYVLARLFAEIRKEGNPNVRIHLLSGFVQTLHLASRMVYPRNTKSMRDFSGSWGRPDYMIRRKSMEQNPLVLFQRSCVGKQGILPALENFRERFPEGIRVCRVLRGKPMPKGCDLAFGTVDIADLHHYLKARSVDFIITDPPYAGLVKYLALSMVWLAWLKEYDSSYEPDLRSEITIDNEKHRPVYRRRLQNALKQLHRVLKDSGRLVITFHHKDIREWNDLVTAIRLSGFTFDKVIHQYNKRSGESNVSMPYGTSASDFYIRCVKRRDVDFTKDASGLDLFVVQKAIEIIARRNEPTPFDFIFNGLVPELLQAGYTTMEDSGPYVENILARHSGPGGVFLRTPNSENRAGDIWWFRNPNKHINYPDRPLKDRVEELVVALLRRKVSVRFDDFLGELFRTYPNGLTPDVRALKQVLEKYAFRSAGQWKIKPTTISQTTEHTNLIAHIAAIGRKARLQVYVGRREQHEECSDGTSLREKASIKSLGGLGDQYDKTQLQRIAMIDVLWLSPDKLRVVCAFEVETSTDFTGALQRASNLPSSLPKFMVIPKTRTSELKSIRDPLFLDAFAGQGWRYVLAQDIITLAGYSHPSLEELLRIGRELH